MICRDLNRWLADQAAERLSPARAAALEAHLAACASCRSQAAQIRTAWRDLETAWRDAPTLDIRQEVLQHLPVEPEPVLRLRWLPLAATAAAALSVMLVPWCWQLSTRPTMDRAQVMEGYATDLDALGYGTGDPAVETGESAWEQADTFYGENGAE